MSYHFPLVRPVQCPLLWLRPVIFWQLKCYFQAQPFCLPSTRYNLTFQKRQVHRDPNKLQWCKNAQSSQTIPVLILPFRPAILTRIKHCISSTLKVWRNPRFRTLFTLPFLFFSLNKTQLFCSEGESLVRIKGPGFDRAEFENGREDEQVTTSFLPSAHLQVQMRKETYSMVFDPNQYCVRRYVSSGSSLQLLSEAAQFRNCSKNNCYTQAKGFTGGNSALLGRLQGWHSGWTCGWKLREWWAFWRSLHQQVLSSRLRRRLPHDDWIRDQLSTLRRTWLEPDVSWGNDLEQSMYLPCETTPKIPNHSSYKMS